VYSVRQMGHWFSEILLPFHGSLTHRWLRIISVNRYKLTSWSWALLGKPPVAQLFKNFRTLFTTRGFINMFTRPRHCPLSLMNPVHTTPSCSSKIYFNIILPLCLGVPNDLFRSGLPCIHTKKLTVIKQKHSQGYRVLNKQLHRWGTKGIVSDE
jgi:hypothetical protein